MFGIQIQEMTDFYLSSAVIIYCFLKERKYLETILMNLTSCNIYKGLGLVYPGQEDERQRGSKESDQCLRPGKQ